jgi:dynein heavy chain
MIVIKSLRSDKVIPAIQNFITAKLGKQYILVPVFDLNKCYKDSSIITPLIFVLSPGSDPVADFLKFAEDMSMSRRVDSISLGQGQGPKAEKLIKECT